VPKNLAMARVKQEPKEVGASREWHKNKMRRTWLSNLLGDTRGNGCAMLQKNVENA
jgi:hypothetical protein